MENFKLHLYSPEKTQITPNINEIYRYSGGKGNITREIKKLVNECLIECSEATEYKAVYMCLPVTITVNEIDFGAFKTKSEKLRINLSNVRQCIVFAATIGMGIDRLISKYSTIRPSKALLFQAVGTELIEAFCNNLCDEIQKREGFFLKPRFSPGYGDLSIDCQSMIAEVLSMNKFPGITLTENMLMRPSKSVTAFCGIVDKSYTFKNKCMICENKECSYRQN